MITVIKQLIHIFPQGETYYGKYGNSATVSQQFFTDKEIAKISGIFFAAASRTGAQIQVSSEECEIPGDVEENYKLKFEAAEKEKSETNTKLTEMKREKLALEIKIAANALYEDNPDNLTLFCCIEQKLSELVTNSWERDGVRKVLETTGVLPKEI